MIQWLRKGVRMTSFAVNSTLEVNVQGSIYFPTPENTL